MKALFLLITMSLVSHTALAEELLSQQYLSVKCHKEALNLVKAKKESLDREVQENEAPGVKVFFIHMGVTAAGGIDPLPITISNSSSLIYALGVREPGASKDGYGGYLAVQCRADDATKVNDLNQDGKVDVQDVVWGLD